MLSVGDYRGNIVDVINRAKDEIINLRNDIESNKDTVQEIKDIISRLRELETAIKPTQRWFKEKINSLDLVLEELSEIRYDITLENTNEMFETIDRNLLDGMKLEDTDNEYLKEILFNNEKVGSIEVIDENKPEVTIRVTVYENSDEFDIREPRRMYSIISFINTKFNYKET